MASAPNTQWTFPSHSAMLSLVMLLIQGLHGAGAGSSGGAVHTVLTTECSSASSFQSLALAFSHKKVKQQGAITRIMACTPAQMKAMSLEDLDAIPTHVMPDMPTEPEHDNVRSLLNWPAGIMHWLKRTRPQEEWMLILGPGVIFREPIDPAEFNIPQGWARSGRFPHFDDLRNELATRHEPSLPLLNDTFGGEEGRQLDAAGSFYLLRRTDLQKLLPLYMKYAEDVYNDPDVQQLAGGVFNLKGGVAHPAEVFAWSLAMAKLGIRQVVDEALQVHPSRPVTDAPKLIHYGSLPRMENLTIDDDRSLSFNTESCPPWNLNKDRSHRDSRGLFPHPPYPSEIPKRTGEAASRYAQLLAMESVNIINEALCERHRAKCPESWELLRECTKVLDIAFLLDVEFARYKNEICQDSDSLQCAHLIPDGGCSSHWLKMSVECRRTCGFCFNMLQPMEATDDTSLELETVESDNSTAEEQGTGYVSLVDPSLDVVDISHRDTDNTQVSVTKDVGEDSLVLDYMSVVEFQRKCRALTLEELRENRECAKWMITEGLESTDQREEIVDIMRTERGIDKHQSSDWKLQMPLIGSAAFVIAWMAYASRRRMRR